MALGLVYHEHLARGRSIRNFLRCVGALLTAVSRRQLSFLNWKIGIGNGDNLCKEASQISAFVYTTAGARRMKPRA